MKGTIWFVYIYYPSLSLHGKSEMNENQSMLVMERAFQIFKFKALELEKQKSETFNNIREST